MESLLINNFLLVGTAAFFAGMLNALAGGGTFLTLPSLIFIGVPPVVANATSAAALLPGLPECGKSSVSRLFDGMCKCCAVWER